MKKIPIILIILLLTVAMTACVSSPTFDDDTLSVVFFTNTGQGGSYIPTIRNIVSGTVIQQPDDPTRRGTAFLGWYTDTTFTTEFDFSQPITESVVVFAQWEYENYTITWVLNGGEFVNPQSIPLEFNVHTNRIVFVDQAGIVRENHAFRGWFMTPDFSGGSILEIIPGDPDFILRDITLYARWIDLSGE